MVWPALAAALAAGGAAALGVLVADLRGRVRRLEAWRRAEIQAARPRWEQFDPTYGPPERQPDE